MKVAQINGGVFGSTGRIMFGIQKVAEQEDIEVRCFSPVTATNRHRSPREPYTKIGSYRGRQLSVFQARLTGKSGCYSYFETRALLRQLKAFQPDLIQLHTLHDSFVNVPALFAYIRKHQIPLVWTLHDCWAFTGHCTYFTAAGCDRWENGCGQCPQRCEYPKSFVDRSAAMWRKKKAWFTGLKNVAIVTPSQWLAELVGQSFLKEYPIRVIHNGIDLSSFRPTESDFRSKYQLQNKRIILGVAMPWSERKGYSDYLHLAKRLGPEDKLVLVGLSKEQIAALPENILGIRRTDSVTELAQIYTAADVFLNLTYEDNYPTVNLEARACGTPVITYATGGSPESAGPEAAVIKPGDLDGVLAALKTVPAVTTADRQALSEEARFAEYVKLYSQMADQR